MPTSNQRADDSALGRVFHERFAKKVGVSKPNGAIILGALFDKPRILTSGRVGS